MIVLDASVAVLLFGGPVLDRRVTNATHVMRADPDWLVPEHWRIEFLSTIRGLDHGGKLEAVTPTRPCVGSRPSR